mmetsp:Transcript_32841/g.107346  ORF Transcript_32841/g.107346 Transcript_32841/m.107346 type:complete len:229 (-) Transcript_32841:765-1451(-)
MHMCGRRAHPPPSREQLPGRKGNCPSGPKGRGSSASRHAPICRAASLQPTGSGTPYSVRRTSLCSTARSSALMASATRAPDVSSVARACEAFSSAVHSSARRAGESSASSDTAPERTGPLSRRAAHRSGIAIQNSYRRRKGHALPIAGRPGGESCIPCPTGRPSHPKGGSSKLSSTRQSLLYVTAELTALCSFHTNRQSESPSTTAASLASSVAALRLAPPAKSHSSG